MSCRSTSKCSAAEMVGDKEATESLVRSFCTSSPGSLFREMTISAAVPAKVCLGCGHPVAVHPHQDPDLAGLACNQWYAETDR